MSKYTITSETPSVMLKPNDEYGNISSIDFNNCDVTIDGFLSGNSMITDIKGDMHLNNTDLTSMFATNTALTSCTIDYNESVTTIESAFAKCYNIQIINVDFPNTTNAQGAFYKCERLTDLNFGKLSAVTNAKKMLGCDAISHADLSLLSKCENYYQTFYLCKDLTDLKVNIESATDMFKAFAGCESLTSLTLIGNGEHITDLGGAFSDENAGSSFSPIGISSKMCGCPQIKEFTINGLSLVNIGNNNNICAGMFGSQNGVSNTYIEKVNLGSCPNLSNVKDAFVNCTNLKEVVINDCTNISNYSGMFAGCTSLTSVTMTGLSSDLQSLIKNGNSNISDEYWHF